MVAHLPHFIQSVWFLTEGVSLATDGIHSSADSLINCVCVMSSKRCFPPSVKLQGQAQQYAPNLDVFCLFFATAVHPSWSTPPPNSLHTDVGRNNICMDGTPNWSTVFPNWSDTFLAFFHGCRCSNRISKNQKNRCSYSTNPLTLTQDLVCRWCIHDRLLFHLAGFSGSETAYEMSSL